MSRRSTFDDLPGDLQQRIHARTRVARAVLAVYTLALAALLLLPQGTAEPGAPRTDLILHVLAFGFFGTVLWRALPPRWGDWKRAVGVIVITAAVGGATELGQHWATVVWPQLNRHGSLEDAAFDALGGIMAAAGSLLFRGSQRDARLAGESMLQDLTRR